MNGYGGWTDVQRRYAPALWPRRMLPRRSGQVIRVITMVILAITMVILAITMR